MARRTGRTLRTLLVAAGMIGLATPALAQNRLFGGVRPGGSKGAVGVRPGLTQPTRGVRDFGSHPAFDPRNFDASWRPAPSAPAPSRAHSFDPRFRREHFRDWRRDDWRDHLRDDWRRRFDQVPFGRRIDGRFDLDSGLRLRGRWEDDDWKLKLHVGDPFNHRAFDDHFFGKRDWFKRSWSRHDQAGFFIGRRHGDEAFFFGVHGPASRRFVFFGSPYTAPYYPYYRPAYYHEYYDARPIAYPTASIDPQLAYQYGYESAMEDLAREGQLRDLAPLERARIMLAAGDATEAIGAYCEHLGDSASDAAAVRELAMALLAANRYADGVAMMRLAYEQDPTLAHRPVDPRLLGPDASGLLREMIRRIAPMANSMNASSPWLAEAVLMQAEGRLSHGRRMLRRAIDAGLEERIAAPLAAELGLSVREFEQRN